MGFGCSLHFHDKNNQYGCTPVGVNHKGCTGNISFMKVLIREMFED